MDDTLDHARCPACGFAAADWDERDTANTIALGAILRSLWADGLDPADPALAPLLAAAPTGARQAPTPDDAHALWHDLLAIDALRRRRRIGTATGDTSAAATAVAPPTGSVVQLSASGGGVPKRAVDAAEIGWRGVVGDVQHTRQHHGRPWQALCLWSADVIDALVAEGHPIFPGAAGENVTVRGLDWAALHAGDVLELGGVRCQLSAQAIPCTKNNQWFADGDSRRIHHERHPGWSRWYASVLQPGRITVGDAVTVA